MTETETRKKRVFSLGLLNWLILSSSPISYYTAGHYKIMILFTSIFFYTSKSCMCCSTRLVLCVTITGRPTVSKYVKCSSRFPSSILNGAFSWMLLQKDFHFCHKLYSEKGNRVFRQEKRAGTHTWLCFQFVSKKKIQYVCYACWTAFT